VIAEGGSGESADRKLHLTVITGLSGAGKSEVVATFEDMGYFCIDNLPPQMVPGAVELFSLEGSRVNQAALVFDARGGKYFEELGRALDYLRSSGTSFRVLYLEASDEALVARYQATRRPHPLSRNLREGIERERRLLSTLRAQADLVIDTTNLSPRGLRRHLEETLLADRLHDQLFVLRLPLWTSRRGRHGARCQVLAESVLGSRSAADVGPRSGGEGIRPGPGGLAGLFGAGDRLGALPWPSLRGRTKAQAGSCSRLHRRPAPVGGADGGVGPTAEDRAFACGQRHAPGC
jgi:hypothetical protein